MKKRKYASLFFIIGWLYIAIEVTLRVVAGDPLTNGLWNPASLCGWASLWMFFVGGTSGFLLGWLDEDASFRERPMLFQALIGGLLITAVELAYGLFFNKLLGLALWDYSTWSFNLFGQISLLTSSLWVVASPFGYWLDNVLRHYMYGAPKPDSLGSYYLRLITLK